MTVSYVVTVQSQPTSSANRGPDNWRVAWPDFDSALKSLHDGVRALENYAPVGILWAKQGHRMWPVRILYPGMTPDGYPHRSDAPSDPPIVYMASTEHPLSVVYLPDERNSIQPTGE